MAVGAIDGTSHEVYRPLVEDKEEFYTGYHGFYCLHSQDTITNDRKSVHIASGFLGHNSDAGCVLQMDPVGSNLTLHLSIMN